MATFPARSNKQCFASSLSLGSSDFRCLRPLPVFAFLSRADNRLSDSEFLEKVLGFTVFFESEDFCFCLVLRMPINK